MLMFHAFQQASSMLPLRLASCNGMAEVNGIALNLRHATFDHPSRSTPPCPDAAGRAASCTESHGVAADRVPKHGREAGQGRRPVTLQCSIAGCAEADDAGLQAPQPGR